MQTSVRLFLLLLLLSSMAVPVVAQLPPRKVAGRRSGTHVPRRDPAPRLSRQDSLLLAAATDDVPRARRLLAHGARVDRPYRNPRVPNRWEGSLMLPGWELVHQGETPLHVAVRRGHLAMTDFLLSHGANPLGPDDGASPLAQALRYVPNQVAVVERLLATGVAPDEAFPEADYEGGALAELLQYHCRLRYEHQPPYQYDGAVPADWPRAFRRYQREPPIFWRSAPRLLEPIRTDSASLRLVQLLLNAGADSRRGEPLFEAIECGDRELVRYLLTHGVGVNDRSVSETTALQLAVQGRDPALVTLLLSQGADPRLANCYGETALHWAARLDWPAAVQQLLRAGAAVAATTSMVADPEKATVPGDSIANAAAAAIADSVGDDAGDERLSQLYLLRDKWGYDPAYRRHSDHDSSGSTPLHWAARAGASAVVQALLSAGAPADTPDARQQTPLLLALQQLAELVRHERTESWLHRPNLSEQARLSAVGAQLLRAGARADYSDLTTGQTLLHLAVEADDTLLVRLLLGHGADPGRPDRQSRPPLARATSGPVLRLLLAHGARLDQPGASPLLNPGLDLAVVQACMAAGLSPRRQNLQDETPLHLAAADSCADPAIIRLYLAHGAEVNALTEGNQTPLHLAAKSGHLAAVQTLLAAGADPNFPHESTALMWAARHGNPGMVQALLARGAQVNLRGYGWGTPLHGAMYARQPSPAVVGLLLAAGANPNATMGSPPTAPIHSLLAQHLTTRRTGIDFDAPEAPPAAHDACVREVFGLLLAHGARPEARSMHGQTVAQVLRARHTPLSRQLLAELGKPAGGARP